MAPPAEEITRLIEESDGTCGKKHEENSSDGLASNKVKETLIIIILLISQVLCLSVDLFLVPFFAYEASKRGLSETQAGVILGSFDLARFFAGPATSFVEKRITPKRTLILGACISGTACIAFGFVGYAAHHTMLILCILLRMMSGTGSAMYNVAATSILLKSKFYERATIFGWTEAAMAIGQMFGLLAGGGIYKGVGYNASFYIMGSVVILITLPNALLVPNIVESEKKEKNFFDLLKIPGVVILFLVLSTCQFTMTGCFTMLSMWVAQNFDIEVSTFTLVYAIFPVGYFVMTPIASKITNKGFIHTTITSSWFVLIACIMLACPSPFLAGIYIFRHQLHHVWWVVLTIALASLSRAFLYNSMFQAILNLLIVNGHDGTNVHTFARISAMISSGFALGAMFGPPASGLFTNLYSFPWSLTILSFTNIALYSVYVLYLVIMRCSGRQLKEA